MRELARRERILQLIREIWDIAPDMRLGQILSNAGGSDFRNRQSFDNNVFYYEDDKLEQELQGFRDSMRRLNR